MGITLKIKFLPFFKSHSKTSNPTVRPLILIIQMQAYLRVDRWMVASLDQQHLIIQELLQNVEPQAPEQTCQVRSSPQVTLGHIRM